MGITGAACLSSDWQIWRQQPELEGKGSWGSQPYPSTVKETKIRGVRYFRKYFFPLVNSCFFFLLTEFWAPLLTSRLAFLRGGARKGAPTEGCTKMAATRTHLTALSLFHIFSLYSLAMNTGCFFSSLFTSTELEFQEKHIQPLRGLWSKRWELAQLSAWPLPDHSVLLFPPKDGVEASSSSRVSFCKASGSGKLPVPPPPCWGSLPRWKQPGKEKYMGPSSVMVRLKDQHPRGDQRRGEKRKWRGWGKGKAKEGSQGVLPLWGQQQLSSEGQKQCIFEVVSSWVHKSSGGVHITEMPRSAARDCVRADMKSSKNGIKEPLPR